MNSRNLISEQIIKSKDRVRDFAEVFTPAHMVSDMLDLIPKKDFNVETTFLEPSCGHGNFLVQILERKLDLVNYGCEAGILTAVGSIYGIDIQQDNVEEARKRMLDIVALHTDDAVTLFAAMKILETNIIQGDFLKDPINRLFGHQCLSICGV